jgi:hypothetical protein
MRQAFKGLVFWEIVACLVGVTACLIPTVPRTPAFWGLQYETGPDHFFVYVRGVLPGSPAEASGLEPDDRIEAVEGQARLGRAMLDGALRRMRPGSEVKIKVSRLVPNGPGNLALKEVVVKAVGEEPQAEAIYYYAAQVVALLVCVVLAVLLVVTQPLAPRLWRPLTVTLVGLGLALSMVGRWSDMRVYLARYWFIDHDHDPTWPRVAIQGVVLGVAASLVVLAALEIRGILGRRLATGGVRRGPFPDSTDGAGRSAWPAAAEVRKEAGPIEQGIREHPWGRADVAPPDPAMPAQGPEAATTAFRGPAEPPAPAELVGLLPKVEVLGLLGRGGMGAVYKARQVKVDRLVALKVLPPEAGRDPAFAARFAREARALARLSHPGVVGLHDFGEAGGLLYLLMEYVDGGSLRDVLRKGPAEPLRALGLVRQVCEALQYAHDRGVVHRDLKPENILLDTAGRAKIADFGLAKLLGAGLSEPGLTASQQALGTLNYMAPEQLETPLEVDHRADLYALGVVLYELLTGTVPRGHFAPPSQKAAVGERGDAVVLRALEREPARRFQSAAEMGAAVAALEEELWEKSGKAAAASHRPEQGATELWPLRLGAGLDAELIRQRLRWPALALMLAGAAACLYGVGLGVGMLALLVTSPHPDRTDPLVMWVSLLGLVIVVQGVTAVLGGWKMRRLEAYRLATLAALLVLVPLSLVVLLGLPAGIWALVLLRQPVVAAAFRARHAARGR